jgi:molecular chaperone GrpE
MWSMRSSRPDEPTEQTESGNTAAENSQAELGRLKAELGREHDMYLRALADFENYRGRVDRERAKAADSGKRELILPLLDVVDGFDRALAHATKVPAGILEGFHAIHRNLLDLLKGQGVTPIVSLGQPFDPAIHEAIGTVEGSEYPAGSVAGEVRRGYRFHNALLRPARVRVAQ